MPRVRIVPGLRNDERGDVHDSKGIARHARAGDCAAGLVATAGRPSPAVRSDTVHKNVGVVRFTTADGRFRCSGTLISQTVVLTAGHCTEGPATNVYVSFDDTLQPDPLQPGITPAEKAAREAHYITGTAHPDPGLDGQADVGQAARPGRRRPRPAGEHEVAGHHSGAASPVGYLDGNQGALKNQTFTLVGYGVDIGDKKAQIVVQRAAARRRRI